MKGVVENIRDDLIDNSDESTRKGSKRFFKEETKTHGVKGAVVTKISQSKFKAIKHLPKDEIFNLCEQLLASGFMEESFIACNWAHAIHKEYTEDDFIMFERWVNKYVSNWATCDTLCNNSIGSFLEMYPAYIERLKEWTESSNRWVRRASAVSLIAPAKKGLFKEDIFIIADKLLLDSDDLVQKGYGWMLKVLCTKHEDDVYDYVLKNRATMPRTALRYAIEKMPDEKRKEAMKRI